jgi:hypothetical protein
LDGGARFRLDLEDVLCLMESWSDIYSVELRHSFFKFKYYYIFKAQLKHNHDYQIPWYPGYQRARYSTVTWYYITGTW